MNLNYVEYLVQIFDSKAALANQGGSVYVEVQKE